MAAIRIINASPHEGRKGPNDQRLVCFLVGAPALRSDGRAAARKRGVHTGRKPK